MFEWLSAYKRILVTGPHRAGTRICTKMIACDTGYKYVDEMDIRSDSLEVLYSIFSLEQRFVVQCPALCRYMTLFSADDTAIIMMRRSPAEIAVSQDRIKWPWEKLELARYGVLEGSIADVKYRYWDEVQRAEIRHAFDVDYHSLKDHPLWLPAARRQQFSAVQTSTGEYEEERPGLVLTIDQNPYVNSIVLPDGGYTMMLDSANDQLPVLLNDTAAVIWTLADGTHTFRALLEALQERFEGVDEATLAADLRATLDELRRQGYIRLRWSRSDIGEEKDGR